MKRLIWLCIALWTFTGCGKNDGDDGRCAGVTCERGVCDAATGECSNADVCVGDEQCLEGHLCVESGCFPEFACEEADDCDRGECVAGACVNADPCDDDAQCVHGFRCVAGDCVRDRCASIECDAGVCNPETGACANSVVCTQETQASDCLDGYYCYGQSCELAEQICDEIDCARGVCDPARGSCEQADDCEGSDTNCLQGYFCSEEDVCEQNRCDAEMKECARGTCDPTTAECVNPDDCGSPGDCLDGWSCVEGDCVVAGEECGAAGCPGNQTCQYLPEELAGACGESDAGCNNTHDCVAQRVCRGGACRAGTPCEADGWEPNDDEASALRVAEQPGNIVDGTLCVGDVDVFAFNTSESELFRGELVVDVSLHGEDVGSGEVVVELVSPDGTVTTQASGTSDAARIVHEVTVLNRGEYLIRVLPGDDLYASGVRYSLYVDMLDASAVQACTNATVLDGDPVTDNSSSGASFILGSECTSPDNPAGENVYTFDVTERSWLDVRVTPAPGVDITASVRRRCEVPDDLQCVNDGPGGAVERISRALEPGTYYLIVQGPGRSSGGTYTMTFDLSPIVCGPADSECVTDTTSRFCNGEGTGFEEITCDESCDPDIGRCSRTPRDVCYTAANAGTGFTDVFLWSDFQNDYDPGVGACVPAIDGTQTDGPDLTYEVDLPPDHVLIVDLNVASGDYGSLYVVRDCDDVSGTCVMGANAGRFDDEQLVYFSEGSDTETLYVIADVEFDSFAYGSGSISIDVRPTICEPFTTRCVGDVQETCDTFGTSWSSALCSMGCSNDRCEIITNDACGSGMIDLGVVGSFTGRIDEYRADVSPSFSGCTNRSASGPDAFFEITPASGEIATVEVDADFDASLYAVTDCSDTTGSCVAGSDATSSTFERIQFQGDGTTTYLIGVDSQFSGTGLFTVEATLQAPSCTPGELLGCKDGFTLQYCSPLGVPVDYSCGSSCTNGACDFPGGDICHDPIVLTDGATVSSPFDGGNDIDPGTGTVGACTFASSPQGADRVYAIDLVPGDWLFADLAAGSGTTLMYLMSDCFDVDSCLAATTPASSNTLVYEATDSERVFLVVDRTTSGTSTLTYDLEIDVRRQDCTPGSTPFCSDSNTLTYCDSQGFTRTWDCATTCSGNACDEPTGDVCVDAIVVADGDSIVGNWSTGTNAIEPLAPIDGHCPFDAGLEPRGLDDVYRIELFAGDLLRVDLDTTNSSAIMYVLEDCGDTSSCRSNHFARGEGTMFHHAQQTGSVWVVVDSTSTFASSTTYTVDFDVTPGTACAPDSVSCSGGNVTVCDGTGTQLEHTFVCPTGCANPLGCTPQPAADTCATAPILTGGTVVYGSFADFTNDVANDISGCTGGSGAGADLVYGINAGPGDVIHARFQSWASERIELSIVSDCDDPVNTCLSGALTPDYEEVEVFYAPQTVGTYYVVADSSSSVNDEPFSLEIEVLSVQCASGATMCSANGQTLRICNEHGLWEDYPCDGGCSAGACGQPRGDVCFDAIPLSDGDSHSSEYMGENSVAPSGNVGMCSFASTETPIGVERFFRADLSEGEVLELDFTSSSSYGIVYLLGECGDESSCLANTPDGTSGFLRYSAPQDESVYVVVDRTTSGVTSLSWTLDATILTPDCTPGSDPTCADAQTVSYCDDLGFSIDYACGGANPSCVDGACETPTGAACIDAVVAGDGDSFSGTFQGENSFEVGGGDGTCNFAPGASTNGVDAFYRVDLTAGEVLLADYTSASSSGILYLVGDCLDSSTCIANTGAGTAGRVAYAATQDESVYLVIDRTVSSETTLGWTLDVTVAVPSCAPGALQCAADGMTLEWCNDLGLWESYACDGTCSGGACDTPAGDACVDAIELTDGDVVTKTYTGTNESDFGLGMMGACTFTSDQPGIDHFYRVEMQAGQSLNASYTTTSAYGILSLLRDCNDAATCIANTNTGGSGAVNYTATSDETVFLVMDRGLSGPTSNYDYTLTIALQ